MRTFVFFFAILQLSLITEGFLVNDECISAQPLPDSVTINSFGAAFSSSSSDPACCISPKITGWYYFQPLFTSYISIDTFGSNFDTVLAVYNGTCGGFSCLNLVACNDDYRGTLSFVYFQAVAGFRYYVMVYPFSISIPPSVTLVLNSFIENPNQCNRSRIMPQATEILDIDVTDYSMDLAFVTTMSINQVGSVFQLRHNFLLKNLTLQGFESPVNVTIATTGSTFDTVVQILEGDCGNFSRVLACHDDEYDENFTIELAPSSQRYLIEVASLEQTSPSFNLHFAVDYGGINCENFDAPLLPTGWIPSLSYSFTITPADYNWRYIIDRTASQVNDEFRFLASDYYCDINYGQNITSPKYNLTQIRNPELSFYYYVGTLDNSAQISIDIFDGNTWYYGFAGPFGKYQDDWLEIRVDLQSFSYASAAQITFRINAPVNQSYPCRALIDDVCVRPKLPIPPKCSTFAGAITQSDLIKAGLINLQWVPVGGANYRLYLGTDGSGIFTPRNILNGTIVNLAASYPRLLVPGTYFIRLLPFNSFGSAEDCPIYRFIVPPAERAPLCSNLAPYGCNQGLCWTSNAISNFGYCSAFCTYGSPSDPFDWRSPSLIGYCGSYNSELTSSALDLSSLTSPELSIWVLNVTYTLEAPLAFIDVLNSTSYQWISYPIAVNNDVAWHQVLIDLTPFRGQVILVKLRVPQQNFICSLYFTNFCLKNAGALPLCPTFTQYTNYDDPSFAWQWTWQETGISSNVTFGTNAAGDNIEQLSYITSSYIASRVLGSQTYRLKVTPSIGNKTNTNCSITYTPPSPRKPYCIATKNDLVLPFSWYNTDNCCWTTGSSVNGILDVRYPGENFFYYSYPYNSNTTFESPIIDVAGTLFIVVNYVGFINPHLSFWYANKVNGSSLRVHVEYFDTFNISANPSGYIYNIIPPLGLASNWTRISINLTSITNYSSIIIKLVASSPNYQGDYIYVDELCIREKETLPQCPVVNIPTSVIVDRISWNATLENIEGFYVSIGTSPTNPTNIVNNVYTPASFWSFGDPLTPNTTYYVRIHAKNSIGNTSNCPVFSFKTPAWNGSCTEFDDAYIDPWINDGTDSQYSDWTISNYNYYGPTAGYGGRGLFLTASIYYYIGDNVSLISPVFDFGSRTDLFLTFYYYSHNPFYPSSEFSFLRVYALTSAGSWLNISSDLYGNSTEWKLVVLPIQPNFRKIKITAIINYGSEPSIDQLCIRAYSPNPPLCVMNITQPTSSILDFFGAHVQWNPIFSAEGYYIYLGRSPSNPSDIFNGNLTSVNSIILPELTQDKPYYIRIVPFNYFGIAQNCPIISLRSGIGEIVDCENFTSYNLPANWRQYAFNGYLNINTYSSDRSGDNFQLQAGLYNSNASASVLTSSYDLRSYVSAKASFWYRVLSANTYHLAISVDVWEATTNNVLAKNIVTPFVVTSSEYSPALIDLSSFVGLQIALNISFLPTTSNNIYSFDFIGIDDLCVTGIDGTAPSCSNFFYSPGEINAATYRSPSFSWSPAGNALSYRIYLGTDGNGNQTPTNTVNGYYTTSTQYTFSGDLLLGTYYYFKVVPLNGNVSASSCKIWRFKTEESINTFPYSNSFDGTLGDWINDVSDSGEDFVFATKTEYGPQSTKQRLDSFIFVDDSSPHLTPTNLLSPPFSLVGKSNATASFWYYNYNPTAQLYSELHVDVYTNETWTLDVIPVLTNGSASWTFVSVNLQDFSQSTIVLRLRVVETSSFRSDIAIDEFTLTAVADAEQVSEKGDNGLWIYVGAGTGGAILLVAILIVVIVLVVKKKKKNSFPKSEEIELNGQKTPTTGYANSGSIRSSIEVPRGTTTNYVRIGGVQGSRQVTSNRSASSLVIGDNSWEVDFNEIHLESEVGSGAYGVVWKGKWREGVVAVKVLKQLTPQQLVDFRAEISLMMSLRPHSNVVQLLAVCVDPEKPLCIITEFVERGSLYTLLHSNAQISPVLMLKIAKGIGAGMVHLHLESVVHRDLAARNILLTASFDVKVSDFGLARATSLESGGTTSSEVGPLKWMAPESIMDRKYSPSSDVWAFGVTLYELITRSEPYEELDPVQAATKVCMGQIQLIVFPKFLINNVSRGLNEIMKKCLNKDPLQRPSMKQICTMFEPITP